MKSDLDRLMAEANLDAIVVLGDKAPNAYRDYLTNGSKATGSVFKKRGEKGAFIVVSGMEVGEAAESGLQVYTRADFGRFELLQKHGTAVHLVERDMMVNILRKLEITGRVAFYGVADVAAVQAQIGSLKELMPDLEVVLGGPASSLFDIAFTTKDDDEITRLREAGQRASQIVRETWDFISQHRASNGTVVNGQGKPLTIGDVKKFIHQREIDLELAEPVPVIFAQGVDAAYPHSRGNNSEALQRGKSIVFDFSPAYRGYFHDMTRTWCIDHAPDEVQAAYEDVLHAFHTARAAYKAGESAGVYQHMVCDYFESKGHPTVRSQPGTMDGYVHALGHGLGLNIHEAPSFYPQMASVLEPGCVFTLEPGLYYPQKGYGVRVEDTVYMNRNGVMETLTDAPYDLVLPLKG